MNEKKTPQKPATKTEKVSAASKPTANVKAKPASTTTPKR